MSGEIRCIAGFNAAVIILHEIYGVNTHISDVCKWYHALGYDVYCPNLLGDSGPFPYEQQEIAYTHFINCVGFDAAKIINGLAQGIRGRYDRIFLIGFSVGATIAWRCANSGLYDGVVGYYGSRIREYQHIIPACPVLLVFARHEPSFSPESLLSVFSGLPHVSGEVLEAGHGFCDRHSQNYNAQAAHKAAELTQDFLLKIRGGKP